MVPEDERRQDTEEGEPETETGSDEAAESSEGSSGKQEGAVALVPRGRARLKMELGYHPDEPIDDTADIMAQALERRRHLHPDFLRGLEKTSRSTVNHLRRNVVMNAILVLNRAMMSEDISEKERANLALKAIGILEGESEKKSRKKRSTAETILMK